MQRRKFNREFKVEAVKLVRERGVSVAQASRDLGVHENVLRKWVKELGSDPVQAFPGHGQMKPEQLEIKRLRREVTKLKAERDILKLVAPASLLWPVTWQLPTRCRDCNVARQPAPAGAVGRVCSRSYPAHAEGLDGDEPAASPRRL